MNNNAISQSRRRFYFTAIFLLAALGAGAAWAIPSPELVIGSVSSLSQVVAIAFATLTGSGAIAARKLGGAQAAKGSKYLLWATLGFALLSIALAAGLFLQFRAQSAADLARLQATLVRPAQFDGTVLLDANLKETSFSDQSDHPLAITTEEAAALLQSDVGATFVDVRETGEHAMVTLPGATHVRFPDFLDPALAKSGGGVVLFCHNGNRSSETCERLAALGVDCNFIAGGMEKWLVEGRGLNDTNIKTLADLRALPDFNNKETLLSTPEFTLLIGDGNLQIIDARYPGDFAAGHLPGAINIPIRALPTSELNARLDALRNVPTVAACYDRRSCFMSQVLGYELSQRGIPFLGRYTTPWDYFIAPPPKPHVEAWLAARNATFWDKAVSTLAAVLVWIADRSHLLVALAGLSLASRLVVLPITLKSERDQIIGARHANELKALKSELANDPSRKARAVRHHFDRLGMTPGRNALGLLFLPVMMLGLAASDQAATTLAATLGPLNLAIPDASMVLPMVGAALAIAYLQWIVAKSRRARWLWWIIGAPLTFALMTTLSAAGNIYLLISLLLLIAQRIYVQRKYAMPDGPAPLDPRPDGLPEYIYTLGDSDLPDDLGNKALRLAEMAKQGLPVPKAFVISSDAIQRFMGLSADEQDRFATQMWTALGQRKCAVRSSGATEDGAEHSFAGVFDSVLEIDAAGMKDAIHQVSRSFYSDAARAYVANSDIAHIGNIVLQRMVDAEYAGVAFTQDPSAAGMTMVEFVRGNGEGLVSGRVTPTTVLFGRRSRLQHSDVETPLDLQPLLELCHQIETLFDQPQDIEWAYAKGQFYILQSRDITATQDGSTLIADEWSRILKADTPLAPNQTLFEQDEMAEVLPCPTPLSFQIVAQLWAPGGSLDLACRELGLSYNLPEGANAHLVTLFGRTYANVALKQKLAVTMSARKAKSLRKRAVGIRQTYLDDIVPMLRQKAARLHAVDFEKLPLDLLLEQIIDIKDLFVSEAYVEAEKINVLADFLSASATTEAPQATPHVPVNIIAQHRGPDDAPLSDALLQNMGYRAQFDYELSLPRYAEDPTQLTDLAKALAQDTTPAPTQLAAQFQDLKEQAKHEALRIYAELRRAFCALGKITNLGDLVFQLHLSELDPDHLSRAEFKAALELRAQRQQTLLAAPALPARLSLSDCERLSAPHLGAPVEAGALGGACVSGSGNVTGRAFKVNTALELDDAFASFRDGDIIIARMIHPEWLPYVQRSSAVLSEVGGWLSHMAIVARETGVMMLVKCNGLDQLTSGDALSVGADGTITVIASAQSDAAQ